MHPVLTFGALALVLVGFDFGMLGITGSTLGRDANVNYWGEEWDVEYQYILMSHTKIILACKAEKCVASECEVFVYVANETDD